MVSQVFLKSKKSYQKSLLVSLLLAFLAGIAIWGVNEQLVPSFILGVIASYLPSVAFCYVVFTKKNITGASLKVFYIAEGIKWLLMVSLVILFFTLLKNIFFPAFLLGFVMILLGHSILPFVFHK